MHDIALAVLYLGAAITALADIARYRGRHLFRTMACVLFGLILLSDCHFWAVANYELSKMTPRLIVPIELVRVDWLSATVALITVQFFLNQRIPSRLSIIVTSLLTALYYFLVWVYYTIGPTLDESFITAALELRKPGTTPRIVAILALVGAGFAAVPAVAASFAAMRRRSARGGVDPPNAMRSKRPLTYWRREITDRQGWAWLLLMLYLAVSLVWHWR